MPCSLLNVASININTTPVYSHKLLWWSETTAIYINSLITHMTGSGAETILHLVKNVSQNHTFIEYRRPAMCYWWA